MIAAAEMGRAATAHAGALLLQKWAPIARPIGVASAGGHVSGGPGGGGPLLGVEGAWATTIAVSNDAAQGSGAFGARGGWGFGNGLAAHIRYDYLGVRPGSSSSALQLATVGLRYSVPFWVPLPFAEVDVGPAFVGGDAHFGAGVGLGISVPLGPYVLVDLKGQDWLVPIADNLRQTITAGVGLTINLPSLG